MRRSGTRLDSYRLSARVYRRVVEPLNRGLRSFLLKVCPPRRNMTVLDVGCGTGTQLDLYDRAGCTVCGVDRSPHMLAEARARLEDRAVLCLAEGAHLPLGDSAFDLVVCSMVLHETSPETRFALLGEAGRVLKESGRVVVVDFGVGPLAFPKGHFSKGLTFLLEVLAGPEHFANYREFLVNGGLQPLLSPVRLAAEKKVRLSGGNLVLWVLKKEHTSGAPE